MPTETPSSARCTVRPGDTLLAIARRRYADGSLCPELAAHNGIDETKRLLVGQVLELPPKERLLQMRRPGLTQAAQAARAAQIGNLPAKAVLFPAMVVDLARQIPPAAFAEGDFEFRLMLDGSLRLQKAGFFEDLRPIGSPLGLELKAQYAAKLGRLLRWVDVELSVSSREVRPVWELTRAAGFDTRCDSWREPSCVLGESPNGLSFVFRPRAIRGGHGAYTFEGLFGYRMEVRWSPIRRFVRQFGQVDAARVFVGAGRTVMLTLDEDVVGAAADPAAEQVPFAAAAATMARGGEMLAVLSGGRSVEMAL